MKVWLAFVGLVCTVGGQYADRVRGLEYDSHPTGQYNAVERTHHSGSDNNHLSSGISSLAASVPVPASLSASPAPAIAHASTLSLPPRSGVLATTHHVPIEHYAAPRYSYSYGVHDPTSGDVKEHSETRQGDVVSGSYSVMEADGSMRIVDYTADPLHGFNAVVRNTHEHNRDNSRLSYDSQHGHIVSPIRPEPSSLYAQSTYPAAAINTYNQQLAIAPSTPSSNRPGSLFDSVRYGTTSSNLRNQYSVLPTNYGYNTQTSRPLSYYSNQPSQSRQIEQSRNPQFATDQPTQTHGDNIQQNFRLNQGGQQNSYFRFAVSQPNQQNTERALQSNPREVVSYQFPVESAYLRQNDVVSTDRSDSAINNQRTTSRISNQDNTIRYQEDNRSDLRSQQPYPYHH